MFYQANKAQAVGIADYSVDNFLSVFETSYDENVKFIAYTGTPAHTVRIGDVNRIWLSYL